MFLYCGVHFVLNEDGLSSRKSFVPYPCKVMLISLGYKIMRRPYKKNLIHVLKHQTVVYFNTKESFFLQIINLKWLPKMLQQCIQTYDNVCLTVT